MQIEKYTFGVGDRFAHQAGPQLRACMLAAEQGVEVIPTWNKSHREHLIVGTQPPSVRAAADAAVRELGWSRAYYVDADHINLDTVDGYVDTSDFFTLDVAYAIGKPADGAAIDTLIGAHPELVGKIEIEGIDEAFETTKESVERTAAQFLFAVQEAARIYRHIESAKGSGNFITEVSMDETDDPQTPAELLVILAAIADEGIPIQTIAPKFTGRFNKGVDYVGDTDQFNREFSDDMAVIRHAVREYGLPAGLKLSVHSGSDKFSIYDAIRSGTRKFGAGVHVKTAGTNWLEELIGLAEGGGEGLALARDVYSAAYEARDALCAPYSAVIDIDAEKLPAPAEVAGWDADQYTSALRHDQSCPQFNPHVRQLLHVGYKIAAKMGERYLRMLGECEETISKNVTENLYERHIKPLFLGP
ncbi:MAG: tagaturonate epimerase family protein [Bryobacterales bacterium]|nr:tagaturonate epimerase family protein [Bryobacterales bacterium]MDE0620462.1 tagaturonate epimerase family protein [Bryobacterales bacterium]